MVSLGFFFPNLIFIIFFVQLDLKKWCKKLRNFKDAQYHGTGLVLHRVDTKLLILLIMFLIVIYVIWSTGNIFLLGTFL